MTSRPRSASKLLTPASASTHARYPPAVFISHSAPSHSFVSTHVRSPPAVSRSGLWARSGHHTTTISPLPLLHLFPRHITTSIRFVSTPSEYSPHTLPWLECLHIPVCGNNSVSVRLCHDSPILTLFDRRLARSFLHATPDQLLLTQWPHSVLSITTSL